LWCQQQFKWGGSRDHKDGKEPISTKKLASGDGNFNTKKEMIGFVFDGVKRTMHLPPVKAAAYIKETHTINK